MNNTIRIFLLTVVVFLTVVIIMANRKQPDKLAGCPAANIDMSKMLQYGEQVPDIKKTDRYDRVFDLAAYHDQPVLLLFVNDLPSRIKAYDDSLRKHLAEYMSKGLKVIYITFSNGQRKSNYSPPTGMTVYCDTDSMDLFKAFKVYGHNSCVMLNRKHQVVLSTIAILAPQELGKIIRYKEADIF